MQQNYIHILIHNKRLEKGYSLESLSHGICSTSYLSKLEKGTIEPKEDIVHLLLKKLEIQVEQNLEDLLPKIEQFYHSFVLYHIDESNFLTRNEISRLLNSVYCLDGLLIQAWQYNEGLDTLKEYADSFSYIQKKRYYQILVHNNQFDYHNLLQLFPEMDTYSIIASSLYQQGKYAKSIPYFIQYYNASCQAGDIENMIYAKFRLGNVYACLLDIDSCLEEYSFVLSLLEKTKSMLDASYIYYNLAATYTELKQYDKALDYLEKIGPKFQDALYFHKLALCYEKTNHIDKAKLAIQQGLKSNASLSFLFDPIQYRLDHVDYIRQEKYESILLSTLENIKNELSHGFLYLAQSNLCAYYEANRRYKEAYQMLKNMRL